MALSDFKFDLQIFVASRSGNIKNEKPKNPHPVQTSREDRNDDPSTNVKETDVVYTKCPNLETVSARTSHCFRPSMK